MIRLEIVDGSLQISTGGSIILVAPKDSCAIDVLSLYEATPRIFIYNKYLGTSTSIFNNPLSNCEDSTGTPFTVSSFIAFAEANLGFNGGGSPSTPSPFEYNANGTGIEPILGTNDASGTYATIGGGFNNQIPSSYLGATIGGGGNNTASANYSVIGGGQNNCTSGYISTISGGINNNASGYYSTIGGGFCNTASGYASFVGSGKVNTASGQSSTIGGGYLNTASGYCSTIGGGYRNCASGGGSTIGGGFRNIISTTGDSAGAGIFSGINNSICGYAQNGIIVGGNCNSVIGNGNYHFFIGGGMCNSMTGDYAGSKNVIVGGFCNSIKTGGYSFIGGGRNNQVNSYCAVVVGGASNNASGFRSFVGGGFENFASGEYSAILGGAGNNTNNFQEAMIVGSQITANRALTTFVNNLSIMNIPTSSAGLPSGSVWSNGNVLTIVP